MENLPASGPASPTDERLDSWKEIAAYLRRSVRGVQRWEAEEGMPVHRHRHDKRGTVFAFKLELDAWWRERGALLGDENGTDEAALLPTGREPAAARIETPAPPNVETREHASAVSALAPPRSARAVFIGAGFALAVLSVVLIAWLSRNGSGQASSTRPLSFKARDWVLVTRFENRTGRPIFDGALETALEHALRESRYLNVVPRERAVDALELMRMPADTRIDAAVGREVCLRDGDIRALVTGRIENVGSKYLVSVSLVDPGQGVTAASVAEEAGSEDEALPAIRRASDRLRKTLGEAIPQLRPDGARLAKVTTRSLKALRLYSQAEPILTSRPAAAQMILRQVVAEDPEFAMGHMALSWAIFNEVAPGDWSAALPHSETALRLSESASDRERYIILGGYHHQREKDWENPKGGGPHAAKAVAAFEALLALYPDDLEAVDSLVPLYRRVGRHADFVRCAYRRADLTPNDGRNQSLAISHGLGDGDLAGVERYVQRARALLKPAHPYGPAVAFIEMFPAFRLWAGGDVTKGAAEAERIWGEIEPTPLGRHGRPLQAIASFFLSLGKLRAAEGIYQRVPDTQLRLRGLALVSYYRGDGPRLAEHLKAAVAKPDEVPLWDFGAVPPGEPVLAILLARAGMLEDAERIVSREKRRKGVPEYHKEFARVVDGELAFARGRRAETIRLLNNLEGGVGPGFSLAAETLASALRDRGDVEEAIRVLEPGERGDPATMTSNWDSEAHAWLRTRALLAKLYRQAGRESDAAKVEQDLARLLSAADPDHPILVAVKESRAAGGTAAVKLSQR